MYLHIGATKHKYYSRKMLFQPGKTNNRHILKLSCLCNDLHLLDGFCKISCRAESYFVATSSTTSMKEAQKLNVYLWHKLY